MQCFSRYFGTMAVVALALNLWGCGKDENKAAKPGGSPSMAQGIIGLWNAGDQTTMRIDSNQVTVAKTCTFQDQSPNVTSQASVPANFSGNTFTINSDADHIEYNSANHGCEVFIYAGSWTYTISGNQLKLVDPNYPSSSVTTLTRM